MPSFESKVNGIPCTCKVIHYKPFVPAKTQGYAENWEEEIPSEFDYELYYTGGGMRARGLEAVITDAEIERLQDEYEAWVTATKHGIDY